MNSSRLISPLPSVSNFLNSRRSSSVDISCNDSAESVGAWFFCSRGVGTPPRDFPKRVKSGLRRGDPAVEPEPSEHSGLVIRTAFLMAGTGKGPDKLGLQ